MLLNNAEEEKWKQSIGFILKEKRQLYLDSHSLIIDFITTNEKQKDYKEVKSQQKHSKKVGREWKECREIV